MSFVKDVCLTTREFYAKEALSVGLVSGIEESKAALVKKGLEMAMSIAKMSPVAVQGTKEVLNYSRDHTVADGMSPRSPESSFLLFRSPSICLS